MSLREKMQVKAQAREDKANETFRRHDRAPIGKVMTLKFKPDEDILQVRRLERYMKNGWTLETDLKTKMIGKKHTFIIRKVGYVPPMPVTGVEELPV